MFENSWLELKEMKRQKTPSTPACETSGKSDSSKAKGVQLSITEFYRATKTQQTADTTDLTNEDEETSTGKRKASSSSTLSKSVRRRLLFD